MNAQPHAITIRAMEKKDIHAILGMINLEGWDYHISEIERIIEVSPGTSIVACQGDTVVGGITASASGNRCVLGHVVIDGNWRNKGIGSRLIQTLMDNASAQGTEFFDVFSVKKAIPFYRRHGFHSLEDMDTYVKTVEKSDKGSREDSRIRDLTVSDLDRMHALDLEVTGFDRKKVIKNLLEGSPGKSKGLFEARELKGFIMGRETSVMHDIGPWTMRTPNVEDATRMLKAVLSEFYEGGPAIAGVAISNDVARQTLSSAGFKVDIKNHRLVRSKITVETFTPGMMSISAFEFG